LKNWKFVNIGIVAFWLVMMGLLVKKTVYQDETAREIPEALKIKEIEKFPLKDQWMGIYIGENKIGYSHTLLRKVDSPQEGYFLREECHLEIKVGGEKHKVSLTGESLLDKEFYPYLFAFVFFSDLGKVKVEGKIKEGKARVKISSSGGTREEVIELKGNPFLASSADFLISSQGLEIGKRYSLHLFDPQTFQIKPVVVQIKKKVRLGSEKAYIVEKNYQGIVTTSYINERGETLKEEGPLGLRMVKELREKALMMGPTSSSDLWEVASIKSNVILDDPRNVTYLKVRLRIKGETEKLKGGVREIRAVKFKEEKSLSLPLKEEKFNKYLSGTLFIQSGEEEIKILARQIVGNQKNAWKAATKICAWVYKNVSKVPTLSIPSALEVLKVRRGDCNEHSVLFAALARAAGIPTRLIAGIVYLEGKFYYHAWVEAFVGKWVALDPTFGQTVVDATHIKLIEGGLSEQLKLMKIVGKLKVEILEDRG
jgi:hypothetical protein